MKTTSYEAQTAEKATSNKSKEIRVIKCSHWWWSRDLYLSWLSCVSLADEEHKLQLCSVKRVDCFHTDDGAQESRWMIKKTVPFKAGRLVTSD